MNDNGKGRGSKIIQITKGNGESPNISQSVVQISTGGVIAIIVTISLAVVSAAWAIDNRFSNLEVQIAYLDTIKTDIESINNEIKTIDDNIEIIDDDLNSDGGVKDQLGIINEALHIKIITIPDDEEYIPVKNSVPKATSGYGIQSSIKIDTKIGIYKNGKDCFVRDVVDERIILTYTEGNSEIYFYGTYNENCHWDGYCVTNVYSSDGILTGICESNFDDGKRLDYKSFYLSKSNSNEWIYVNKENLSESNIGTSIKYEFTYNKIKNFTSTNVKVSDIIFVDDFIEDNSLKMLSYYYGNTSDEEYNDILTKEDIKKGKKKAYLILFDDDGYVEIFYISNFIGGSANDDNGIQIVLDQSPDNYDYFKYEGEIKNNRRPNESGKMYVAHQEILDTISALAIDIDLKWHMEKEQEN